MGLLESLYSKYGREELPQVDLFSLYATGTATPVLTQYFANDLKEAVRTLSYLITGFNAWCRASFGCKRRCSVALQSYKKQQDAF